MKVLVTGANGFLGTNLSVHLAGRKIDTVSYTREAGLEQLSECVKDVDFIFHLAGVNRSKNPDEFDLVNKKLTDELCNAIRITGRHIPMIYSSTIHVDKPNPYGKSKRAAEKSLISLESETGSPVYIYRLPNVFGKWSRPNYNSVVATFCYNVVNNLGIEIDDPSTLIPLVYVDDVIVDFMKFLQDRPTGVVWGKISPEYTISVGELATKISSFRHGRESGCIEDVGSGLTRALYSTYMSYLTPTQFSYRLPTHDDQRGRFVEILKTKLSGQFSFFTAPPGATRGGHFHHTKTEKFLVIHGEALFRFQHVVTREKYEIITEGGTPEIIETVPGWSHDITNVGNTEMLVMLWANEIFDQHKPDTIPHEV